MSDRPADTNDHHASRAPSPWFGRRKRIVAREVDPQQPGETSRDSASPPKTGEVFNPAPRPNSPGDSVLDPTLLGRRQRKLGHSFAYRLTQLTTLGSFLAAALSIACALLD